MYNSNSVWSRAGRLRRTLTTGLLLGLGLIAQQASAQVSWGGNYPVSHFPTNIDGIRAISASTSNIGVIEYGGNVLCWGEADDNQNNVPAGLKAKQIAAGQYYFAAVTLTGEVVCWGNNGFNQCDVPAGLTDVKSVAAGSSMVVALKSDGSTVVWGANGSPWIPTMTGIKQVSAFASHYVFVERHGVVRDNLTGIVGSNAASAAAGQYHVVILHPDGTVSCAGENSEGQCNVPPGLTDVQQVCAGHNYSMALKSDGSIVCWGGNESGQLNAPTDTGYTQIAAGPSFGVGVRSLIISVNPRIIGGQSAIGKVVLTEKAPFGGTTISLSSGDPLVTVPSTLTIPEGYRDASFSYDAGVPASTTDVTLSATDTSNGATTTSTIRVVVPALSATVSQDTFVSGSMTNVTMEVDILSPAPTGGVKVTLSSTDPSVTVPAYVIIPKGKTFVKFALDHDLVHVNTDVSINYSVSGVAGTLALHVRPFAIQSMTFSPDSIIGDRDGQLQLTLNATPRPIGTMIVSLLSSNPSILHLPASTNFLGRTATVFCQTNAVSRIHVVTATATLEGTSKKARLTVNP